MRWKTWVFDCDGVLLNSNAIKREAMYQTALDFGSENAKKLIAFHIKHGGISREIKFRWFLENIMETNIGIEKQINEMKMNYSKKLWENILSCEEADNLQKILNHLKKNKVKTFVVSGSDQDELREILKRRNIDNFFDGIYGAPENKDQILSREIQSCKIEQPAVFLGDSQYDYEASTRLNMDFVFLYEWTDFEGWDDFFKDKNQVTTMRDINQFFTSIVSTEEGI